MKKIPFVDLRRATPLELLKKHPEGARNLLAASRNAFGSWARFASHAALPLGDALARRWLKRTRNPYFAEIESYAAFLKEPGVRALNIAYEFGCTTGAYATGDAPQLNRVLDWPFEGLGAHMVVALSQGPAGEFHNITWPAVSGVFSALAKSRFAVALNQAPMRRHRGNLYLDWLKNRWLMYRSAALPPAHLLRDVCEKAASFEEARQRLLNDPVALPVIFTLTGTRPGEACVIERLETLAAVRDIGSNGFVNARQPFPLAFERHRLWLAAPRRRQLRPRLRRKHDKRGRGCRSCPAVVQTTHRQRALAPGILGQCRNRRLEPDRHRRRATGD